MSELHSRLAVKLLDEARAKDGGVDRDRLVTILAAIERAHRDGEEEARRTIFAGANDTDDEEEALYEAWTNVMPGQTPRKPVELNDEDAAYAQVAAATGLRDPGSLS